MNADQLKALEDAFEKLVELSPSERAPHLARLEADDPRLAEQLRRLLAAHEATGDTLASPVAASIKEATDELNDPWVGRRLGAWVIRRRIGSGGMGAVFLAERADEQFSQTAAVKVMAAQLLDPGSLARFRAERQILANLSHPNIAVLLDGGSTDEGLPFLVMEYVEGAPIDEYCDGSRLDIPERLTLFSKVCSAVDYAHRNLVVHRDLKPRNILVGADGEPKLLDFGIAKLLSPDEAEEPIAVTRDGARAMTPEYASPEQVNREPVTIATDIYALGVLLFRLLTGQSPYGAAASTQRDLERAILQSDPKSPSSVVSTSPSASHSDVGADRATTIARLRRTLSGDLDNIVLKCLQKEPERRYLTAKDLAADLARYLNSEPVSARGDDSLYRLKKFLVRRSAPLAATAAGVAIIGALTVYYPARLAGERDRASLAAREAEEVSEFLTGLFRSASPFAAQGDVVTAIDLLEEGRRRIGELSDQPIVQSKLYRTMGYSFSELGQYERGLELLEASVAVLDDVDGVDPLLLADNLFALAETQRLLRRFEESIENRRRVVQLRESVLGPEHGDVAYALARLGSSLGDSGRPHEALPYLLRAREIKTRLGETQDDNALDVLGVTAVNLGHVGRYEEAASMNEEAIALSERLIGVLNPNTIIRVSNAGIYSYRLYLFEKGLAQLDEAIERGRKTWPEEHPQFLYFGRWRARLLQGLGRFAEAQAALEELERRTLATSGARSIDFVYYKSSVGMWRLQKGEHAASVAAYSEGRSLAVELTDEASPVSLFISGWLGGALAADGKLPEAESVLAQVLEHRGSLHFSEELTAVRFMTQVLSRASRYDEASALIEDLLIGLEERSAADQAAAIEVYIDAAAHYRRMDDLDRAEDRARRAATLSAAALPPGNWVRALAAAELAHVLRARGDEAAAQPLFREAHAGLLATFGAEDARVEALAPLTLARD